MTTCSVCGIDFDKLKYPDGMIQHVIRHRNEQQDGMKQSHIEEWIES